MVDKNETFEDFLKRHGYKDGVAGSMEETIYWISVWSYEKKWNWRRCVVNIRKILKAYKESGKNENMLENKFHKALSEILIEDNELTYHFDTNEVSGWPNIEYDDGVYTTSDPLDMENCGYLSLTDTEFTMVCGGDWQNPHKVVIVMGVDGLEVSNCEPWDFDDTSDEFEEELSNKLFVYKALS